MKVIGVNFFWNSVYMPSSTTSSLFERQIFIAQFRGPNNFNILYIGTSAARESRKQRRRTEKPGKINSAPLGILPDYHSATWRYVYLPGYTGVGNLIRQYLHSRRSRPSSRTWSVGSRFITRHSQTDENSKATCAGKWRTGELTTADGPHTCRATSAARAPT